MAQKRWSISKCFSYAHGKILGSDNGTLYISNFSQHLNKENLYNFP